MYICTYIIYKHTYYYIEGLKQYLVAAKTAQKIKIQGTILQGTGIPCTRCVSHAGYLMHGNSKSETRGRSRYKNNS